MLLSTSHYDQTRPKLQLKGKTCANLLVESQIQGKNMKMMVKYS